MAKLSEQRGCSFLLSPWPCWGAPQGLSHRASLPRLARGSCEEPREAAPAAGEAGPHLPSLRCLAVRRPSQCGRAATLRVAEQRRAERRAACPRWGDPYPPRHRRQPEGTEDIRRGICGDFSSAETLRWLPAVRTGAAAGGSSRLSGTGGAQGALLRPSSNLQLVFTPFPAPSLAPLCPDLAEGPPLPRFPAPRQALPEETRLRPAQGAGRARSTPVRRQKCFAMRALLCQVTLLLYLFFLNKLLVIYGLCLSFFSSLPPATC